MKNRSIFFAIATLLLVLMVPLVVGASECDHINVDEVCPDCGLVLVEYIELGQDSDVEWVLQQDLFLDLNTFDISGTIDTNGYSIFCMDTSTWYYSCDDIGYFNCVDETGKQIVPVDHFTTDPGLTGFNHRYVSIPSDKGYTAHRFYLGITHSSLKPSTTGLGYKAMFCGDDMVKEYLDSNKAFGYTLRLENYGVKGYYIGTDKLVSEQPISLGINNWDVQNHSETPLFVSVQLRFRNGMQVNTDQRSITLRRQVEAINTNYLSFTESQLNAVQALIERNPIMRTWNVGNIYTPDYCAVDEPVVGTGYKFGATITPLLDTNYYFAGQLSSYYMATDTDVKAVPDVYLEEVSGGYALYFMNEGVKTYINVAYRGSSTSSVCVKLVTDATPSVYKLNTQYQYIYTTLGSRNYYLGTYTSSSGTTYSTLSASNVSYISDVSTIGVTQFPAWFFGPDLSVDNDDPGQTPPVGGEPCDTHVDSDDNGFCDVCYCDVTIVIDLYAINDLHGKFADADSNPGVDELSTYLNNAKAKNDNVILLSSGDMWQGGPESNLTKGLIITDWMNQMGFASMTLGNHEFDWGKDIIIQNAEFAQFPFLAINVYDRTTGAQVDYCQSSVVVEADGIQIGIIGAIGDCYSSISPDRTQDVYFLTGSDLTALVKAEATKLRNQGVDFIVYSLHDGASSGFDHYDTALSNGYVDLVFEGHSHQSYVRTDTYGVYHLQGGGDNDGITYASVSYNTVNDSSNVIAHQVIKSETYSSLNDDPLIEELLIKYHDTVSVANKVLGTITKKLYSSSILQTVADLYCRAGVEKWGDSYDIVLGGGYLNCRSPYDLEAGDITYGMLMSILPFDNRLVLCSVSGSNLKSKFINTSNSSYYISYSDYGSQLETIDNNKTYYIIVDSYTAYYAPNNLTIIDFYDEDVYARDLLADYIENGYLS